MRPVKSLRRYPVSVPELLESRRLLAASVAYLGLSDLDVAGPTAAIGPGGFRNLHVQVTVPLSGHSGSTIRALDIAGPAGFAWTYGSTGPGSGNPQANPVIAVAAGHASPDGQAEVFDAYFSPVVAGVNATTGAAVTRTLANNQALAITVAYSYSDPATITTDTPATDPALIVTPTDLNQALTDPAPSLPGVTIGRYPGSFLSQTADGLAHIQLTGLPAGAQVVAATAELSDVAGLYWTTGATYGRAELAMTITQPAAGGTVADLAFPPERDEADSTMTVRYQLTTAPNQWFVTDVALSPTQHTDPALRDGGPIDPNTPAVVVSPTATPNLVGYVDSAGQTQAIDIQDLLNAGHPVITLGSGTYTITKPLTIPAAMILQGANANVTLNFVGLPASIPHGIINLGASHITLNQFRIRFGDARVNFTGSHPAIISDEDGSQRSRVGLTIENLDIKAPATNAPFDGGNQAILAVPITYIDPYDSGTIANNTVYGGPIAVQGGPWLITGNRVLGAVQGTLNTNAFGASGGHDITLSGNTVSDADPASNGLIDRLFVANHSGYGFSITQNSVSDHVGVAAAVADGSPAAGTTYNPRNNREEVLFEDFAKIFEGSVTAIGVSTSTAASDGRRIIAIPTAELGLFSGYFFAGRWAVTILNGPSAGTEISVIQAFGRDTDPTNSYFLLDAPLPTGTYDLDIAPAYRHVNFAQNTIDLRGTISTGFVFSSTMVDTTVSGNTFIGDRSAEVDGRGNLLQNEAIRVNPYKARLATNYLHADATDESYNVIHAAIDDNTIINAVGGIKMFLEVDSTLSSTAGRTYGFIDLTDNQFRYAYANPMIITLGNSGDYSRVINNGGVVADPAATNFADPRTISLTAAGNTVAWADSVATPATDVVANAVTVNGVLYAANAHPAILTDLATLGTVEVSLGSAFNTVGITSDAHPAAAASSGFDFNGNSATGNSLSADALGGSGGTLTWSGQTFAIGAPGTANVVSLGGVPIALPAGQYSTLLMLGASTYGDKIARFVVHYTDGTTAAFAQTFSDWAGNQAGAGRTAPGEAIAATTAHYNSATGGLHPSTRYLYGYSFALDPTRTVSSLEVINNNNLKLVALDLVRPTSAAATVGDPGFETIPVGAGRYIYGPTGSPWTFAGGAGVAGNASDFTNYNPLAPQGTQVGFLQTNGVISQAVNFAAAGSYQLGFLAAQRTRFNVGGEDFQVLVDGSPVATFRPGGTAYSSFATGAFSVTAGTHVISFKGLNSAGGDNTVFLDAVTLTAIGPGGDPGFETIPVGVGRYVYNPTGSPWTFAGSSGVTGNASDFTGANPAAPQGSQVAFLQTTGSISQAINFAAAGSYQLSFLAAQRGRFNAGGEDFQILVDGQPVGTFRPTGITYSSGLSGSFRVTAGTHVIRFVGLDSAGGDNTVFLDAVNIVPASTPSTTATLTPRLAVPQGPTALFAARRAATS